MEDVAEWLMVLVIFLLVPWAKREAEKDLESMEFFFRYANDLETFYPIEDDMFSKREKVLYIPDGWSQMVADAIGERAAVVQIYVQNLWENGWSVKQIQTRLRERAESRGKQLFFINNLEAHERS